MSLQNPLRANEAMYSTVKGDYFYPQTVSSQVIMEDGSRLNAYLGGMVIPNGMELLWENPDPTAEFVEQTIELDLSEYKYARVLWYESSGFFDIDLSVINKNSVYVFGTRVGIWGRPFRPTAIGLHFESAWVKLYDQTYSSANNAYAIPGKIYGIKENATIGGEGTLLNADMLGNIPAEEYVKKSETGMELLWENANPTNEFAAQTLNLDIKIGDVLLISYFFISGETLYFDEVYIVDNTRKWINRNATSRHYHRVATMSAGEISFERAYYNEHNVSQGYIDTAIVPVKIYKLKE